MFCISSVSHTFLRIGFLILLTTRIAFADMTSEQVSQFITEYKEFSSKMGTSSLKEFLKKSSPIREALKVDATLPKSKIAELLLDSDSRTMTDLDWEEVLIYQLRHLQWIKVTESKYNTAELIEESVEHIAQVEAQLKANAKAQREDSETKKSLLQMSEMMIRFVKASNNQEAQVEGKMGTSTTMTAGGAKRPSHSKNVRDRMRDRLAQKQKNERPEKMKQLEAMSEKGRQLLESAEKDLQATLQDLEAVKTYVQKAKDYWKTYSSFLLESVVFDLPNDELKAHFEAYEKENRPLNQDLRSESVRAVNIMQTKWKSLPMETHIAVDAKYLPHREYDARWKKFLEIELQYRLIIAKQPEAKSTEAHDLKGNSVEEALDSETEEESSTPEEALVPAGSTSIVPKEGKNPGVSSAPASKKPRDEKTGKWGKVKFKKCLFSLQEFTPDQVRKFYALMDGLANEGPTPKSVEFLKNPTRIEGSNFFHGHLNAGRHRAVIHWVLKPGRRAGAGQTEIRDEIDVYRAGAHTKSEKRHIKARS